MDNKKITITIPTQIFGAFTTDLLNSYISVKQKFQKVFILFYETGVNITNKTKRGVFHSMNIVKNGFNNFNKKKAKKLLMLFVPLVIVVILVIAGVQALKDTGKSNATVLSSKSSQDVVLKSQKIDKKFSFPLTDESGKEIGNFSYDIESVELRNEIIVKGQRASAAPERVFFIVNLQLKNTLKQGLQINSRDYIRLSVNGDKDNLLAPEIHNDPVEVQAISTKYTRLGFAINETDKNLILIVGEIDGDKQEIPVKF